MVYAFHMCRKVIKEIINMPCQPLNKNKFRSAFFILLLSLITQAPAFAESTTLDALFLNLKNAANETDAKSIEKKTK